ncbi:MAG: hypothetical protein ACXADA_05095 [Candidatus Hodarchaeales archaeon]
MDEVLLYYDFVLIEDDNNSNGASNSWRSKYLQVPSLPNSVHMTYNGTHYLATVPFNPNGPTDIYYRIYVADVSGNINFDAYPAGHDPLRVSDLRYRQTTFILFSFTDLLPIIVAFVLLSLVFGFAIGFLIHSYRGSRDEKEDPLAPATGGNEYDWVKIRTYLEGILASRRFLPASVHVKDKINSIQAIDDDDQLGTDFYSSNVGKIENLRCTGIDGILICLFLFQRGPSFCSVKIIQKSLKIPLTTVYRTLQKLEDDNYVVQRHILDPVNKAFYGITPEGESLIIDLYDLVGGDELIYVGES